VDVKVSVGQVRVRLTDVEYSPRQVLALLRQAAGVAVALQPEGEGERPAFGFAAQVELDPERNVEPDLSEWFEESP
jgi:predicted amidohydrolase